MYIFKGNLDEGFFFYYIFGGSGEELIICCVESMDVSG